MTRERRAELLARAPADELEPLAEQVLADSDDEPVVLSGPEVGMVMLQVREPVAEERFYAGEVLVTQVEVELSGRRGWCMRLGAEPRATLAAGLLDAAAEGAARAEVEALCQRVADRADSAARAEWAEIAPTEVRFEELDR